MDETFKNPFKSHFNYNYQTLKNQFIQHNNVNKMMFSNQALHNLNYCIWVTALQPSYKVVNILHRMPKAFDNFVTSYSKITITYICVITM